MQSFKCLNTGYDIDLVRANDSYITLNNACINITVPRPFHNLKTSQFKDKFLIDRCKLNNNYLTFLPFLFVLMILK